LMVCSEKRLHEATVIELASLCRCPCCWKTYLARDPSAS
jgi:hypothetical protein